MILDQLSKDDASVINFLKAAYYLAKNELPKSHFHSVLELLTSVGVEVKQSSGATYTSNQSVGDFQRAIASVIREETIEAIRNSGQYAITIDESTDRGNKKRLLIYVDYLVNGAKETRFLSNVQITTGTADAETITKCVLAELASYELDPEDMSGIGTDGASVMTGRKNGVVVKLKQHSPNLIGVHCAAHRCALATSQAANSIDEIKAYARTVSNVFYYFSNSALRQNKLHEIQQLLELPELKYAEVHSVRWPSLDRVVQILYRTYPALVVALEHEATSNPTARGLLAEVQQYKFIMVTHMLLDILPFLSRMSKVFQTESVDFSKIKPIVDCTVSALKDLKECPGINVDNLDEFVDDDGEKVMYKRPVKESSAKSVKEGIEWNMDGFSGFGSEKGSETVNEVELKYYKQQQHMVKRVMPLYVDKIVQNLEDRFVESDTLHLFSVLVPACIVEAEKEGSHTFLSYGVKEMRGLCEKYGIDEEECVGEYKLYKRLVVGSFANCSFSDVCKAILLKYDDVMPCVVKMLRVALLIPVSSVPCERGFSTQNRICTKFRTSLCCESLNDLTRISESGPSIGQFNFEKALSAWKKEKARKIYRV